MTANASATPSLLERLFAPIHDDRIAGDLRRASLVLIAAIVLRLIGMAVVPLIPEEAYYWMYGQNPQLSYFDHPPMVAWVIRAGTTILGDNEVGVRLFGTILSAMSSVLMYRLARVWFDARTALTAALLLQVLPVYFGIGFIAPMDSALCFFWLSCLVATSLALKSRGAGWWYAAGVSLGLALLSKYSAIFLGAGVFLASVMTHRGRRHLRTPHPYLGGLLGLLIFSPVLIWNARHGWASFRFQFVDRYAEDRFNLHTPLAFISLQSIVVLTPVLLACVVWILRRVVRRSGPRSSRYVFALCVALPGLLAAIWTSFKSDVHINWTAPIYLSLIPAACGIMYAHDRLLHRRARLVGMQPANRLPWQWLSALTRTALLCGIICCGLMLYLMLLQPRFRVFTAFGPWKELATVVEETEDQLELETNRVPRIVGDGKYRLASVLAFYRMPLEGERHEVIDYTTSQWVFGREGLGFPYWSTPDRWTGEDVVYVSDDKDFSELKRWFASVDTVSDPRLTKGKDYYVAVCRGLRSSPGPSEKEQAAERRSKAAARQQNDSAP